MKIIVLLLAVLLMLSGCKKQPENISETQSETVATETTIPETKPLPNTVIAYADVKEVPILLTTFSRGDTVQVVEAFDTSRTLILHNGIYALIDTALLHLPGQGDYSPWTGYPRWNGKMFDNFHLQGEPTELKSNPVQVIDELSNCYIIELDGTVGYILKTDISRWPASSGSNSDSGSSNGHSSGGGSSDGGEISLTSVFRQSGNISGAATIKADGAEAYLGKYLRGERVDIVESEGLLPPLNGYVVVYDSGLFGYVKSEYLLMDGETGYTEWIGYTKHNTVIYDSFYLQGDVVKKPSYNTEVTVLKELNNCYFISVNGLEGYVAKESINSEKNPVSYGGNSDSGGSGSSSNGGNSNSEWSPPML